MKKKMMAKLGAVALASMLTVPMFAGCGDDGSGLANTTVGNADAEYALNVYVYEAGYGKGWVERAAEAFCEKYPNYQVHITSEQGMFDRLKTELDADQCKADVALLSDADYSWMASNSHLADLTDLMNSPLPESDMLIKDVIPEAHVNYRRLGTGETSKWYGIPWQDNTASGIIYNKKFFRDNNLTIPTTMDEYLALCNKIVSLKKGVAPLTYCGGASYGYTPNLLNQWFLEDVGYEYMTETFFKYDHVDNFTGTEETRKKVYTTLAKMLKTDGYATTNSQNLSADQTITEFLQEKAAMTICGSWFPTEASLKLALKENFEYGFFGIPHINKGEVDRNGNDSSDVRYS
jgi:ABC-type glycerol-3-phosphate transport system substrate-binding protein